MKKGFSALTIAAGVIAIGGWILDKMQDAKDLAELKEETKQEVLAELRKDTEN